MNDEGLGELLTDLILAQDTVSIAVRKTHNYDYSESNLTKILAARDSIHTTIMEGFAALRQQRDELAEACRDLIIEVEESVSLGFVPSTVWAILNDDIKPLLASIEEKAE